MPIKVSCACGAAFAANDSLAGRKVKCPKCKRPISIPAATDSAAATSATRPPAPQKPKSPKASAPSAPSSGSIADMFDEEGLTGGPQQNACPSCGAVMKPEAVLCIDCGYSKQYGFKIKSQVKSDAGVASDDAHSDATRAILAKAARELDKKQEDTGIDAPLDEKEEPMWKAWLMLLAVPLLMAYMYFLFIVMGVSMARVSALASVAWETGSWELWIALVFTFGAVMLSFFGWFSVSMRVLDRDRVLGILALTIGLIFTPFVGCLGLMKWRERATGTMMLMASQWCSVLMLFSLAMYTIFKEGEYIALLPLGCLAAFATLNFAGWLIIILQAFSKKEDTVHGIFIFIFFFYGAVYAAMNIHEGKNKIGLILMCAALAALILTVVLWITIMTLPLYDLYYPEDIRPPEPEETAEGTNGEPVSQAPKPNALPLVTRYHYVQIQYGVSMAPASLASVEVPA